jgi:hypothetical protein
MIREMAYILILLVIMAVPACAVPPMPEEPVLSDISAAAVSNSTEEVVYTSKFGLMHKPKARWEVTEADLIPRLAGSKFGYFIEGKAGVHFSHKWILYMPGALTQTNENIDNRSEVLDDGKTLKGETWARGNYYQVWAFSASDPLGQWKLELYVDDELLRSYSFKVVAPMM